MIGSWSERRKARLEKIKNSKDRPDAPFMEELAEKPGTRELKQRKLVVRSDDVSKQATQDDYI